jgi:putative aminopeptidase FrvX
MSKKNRLQLLKKMSEVFGPSTMEDGVISLIKNELGSEYNTLITGHKNLIVWKDNNDFDCTVMFQAHMDELGVRPYRYLSNGFIELTPTGGIPGILNNHLIQFQPNETNGVMLIRNNRDKRPRYYVDVGATSSEEAMEIVPRHANGAYTGVSFEESKTQLKGKSFDDRAGCAAIVDVLKNWNQNSGNRVVAVFTAREETGNWPVTELYRTMYEHQLLPDLIVNVECCPAEEIPGDTEGVAEVGKGIVLVHMDASYEPDPKLCKFMSEVAEKHNICNQHMAVRAGSGELGRLALGFGVAGYPLTIPCRYMHQPHSVISKIDYNACIDMVTEIANKFQRFTL